MSNYFVTGASGWLGKAVINRLVNGFPQHSVLKQSLQVDTITALVMPGEEAALAPWTQSHPEKISIVSGDVRNPADVECFLAAADQGILIHLAGIIHPKLFVKDFTAINLDGTKNVLSAAISAGVQRAVVMSSNSPIGCNPSAEHRFDETSPYNPYMGYGKSKMLLERYTNSLYADNKLQTVLIRAPWFYGPFQPARQTEFFAMIRDGKAPIVGDGENMRSMAFVDNLAQGILLAAITPAAAGKTYWIADERPYSMNEIVNTVEYLLANEFNIKCKYSRLKLPSVLSEVALVCDWMLQTAGLYHQKIHVLSEMNKNIACSIDKAKQELAYKPLISLEDGMRQSIQQLIDQGQLR